MRGALGSDRFEALRSQFSAVIELADKLEPVSPSGYSPPRISD
jgi:hypothetical protein